MNKKEPQEDDKQILKYYQHVFRTPEGAAVLKDLKARFYDVYIPADVKGREAIWALGARSVIHGIIDVMEAEL